MRNSLILLLLSIFSMTCTSKKEQAQSIKSKVSKQENRELVSKSRKLEFQEFERNESFNRIKNKIKNGESISIHVRIPLCDNEHQGIVPVSKKLGNGLDLKNNLYWGAKYGFKNHFKKYTEWKFLKSELDVSDEILERVIFSKKLKSGTTAYLVADAYRGDKMKVCLLDYLHSVAGKNKTELQLPNEVIGLSSNADLLIFNGHNGLMDYDLDFIASEDDIIRETSVIGCVSHSYFKDHLLASKGYPILMTTNLMAPEAYVMEALIESWLSLKNGAEIRKDAGSAYHQYQKCGINGATKLFKTGW